MPKSSKRLNKKWSSFKTIKFLQLYEEHECLWNRKSRDYTNRDIKNEALEKIMKDMLCIVPDIDIVQVKAKIRSLRNAYILEIHKINQAVKCGDFAYEPTVAWFDLADRFLRSQVEVREIQKNTEICDVESSDDLLVKKAKLDTTVDPIEWIKTEGEEDCAPESKSDIANVSDAEFLPESVSDIVNNSHTIFLPELEPVQTHTSILKRSLTADSVTNTASNASSEAPTKLSNSAHQISNKNEEKCDDEYSLFGKTIANHLKQLPTNISLECQSFITHYVIQKRLNLYNSNASSNALQHNQEHDAKIENTRISSPASEYSHHSSQSAISYDFC